mgnify:CR=1 FL=1
MSIYEIITQGQKDGKLAEINADLAAAGYQTASETKTATPSWTAEWENLSPAAWRAES